MKRFVSFFMPHSILPHPPITTFNNKIPVAVVLLPGFFLESFLTDLDTVDFFLDTPSK